MVTGFFAGCAKFKQQLTEDVSYVQVTNVPLVVWHVVSLLCGRVLRGHGLEDALQLEQELEHLVLLVVHRI